jgi:hypothetical protein
MRICIHFYFSNVTGIGTGLKSEYQQGDSRKPQDLPATEVMIPMISLLFVHWYLNSALRRCSLSLGPERTWPHCVSTSREVGTMVTA